MNGSRPPLPLAGLQVLELANVLAGPSVGMFLAELGAEVIKVENPRSGGDVTRGWKLPTEDPRTDISGYFSSVNWGKQSLAVDLTCGEGLAIVQQLADAADVVLSSYKPGDAEKLRVDFETLRQRNPRLIYAHLTGYGRHNPRAGYDAIIQAEAGFTSMNGQPDGPPTKMPVALMDVLAAHQLKEALLLALLHRERTGQGQYIEASLIRSGVASLINQATNWLVGRRVPGRLGSDHPNIVPYGTIFPTADGKDIVLAVGTDRQFAQLCAILGLEEAAHDPRFAHNQDRVRHKAALMALLEERIAAFPRDRILSLLAGAAIPAGGVFDMAEVFEVPEAAAMVVRAELEDGRTLEGVRSVAFTAPYCDPPGALLPPPPYARHTRRILQRRLGMQDTEIDALVERGVIHAR